MDASTIAAGNRKRSRTLFQLLVGLLIVGGGFCLFVLIAQTGILFQGSRDMFRTPRDAYGWDYEDVWLDVEGRKTHGWFIPTPGARGTVLFSHGNGGNIAGWLDAMGAFRDLGLDVLLYDYGGYGNSTGSPSERRCYADIRAMWRYLTEQRHTPPGAIVLAGRSLGGAVTAELAAEVTPAAVILESTFASAPEMAKTIFPVPFIGALIRHRFDTASKIAGFSSPLLIIHSPEDEVVPFVQGQKLFRLAREPKKFVQIHGGHNDGAFLSADLWFKEVDAFLTPLLKENAPSPGTPIPG